MVFHEVTVDVAAEIARVFEVYMLGKHVPEMLATACFGSISFDRSSETRFRTRYAAATQEDLDRYLTQHAAHFRADFHDHVPAGAVPTREVWTLVKSWG